MKVTSFYEELKQRKSPYVIAELGSNHNGDMKLARELIIQAKNAGADCVKFQSWSKETIFARVKYEDNYFIADDYRNRSDYTLEQIVEEYSISESELKEMKKFADEIGIDCASTPFSPKEADFLEKVLDARFIKVASMDLNNYPFLEYLAGKQLPMILSTGLSELHEIDRAVRVIENVGNKEIVILHCVSTYPPEDKDVNLNNIVTLRNNYPDYLVGFSDHTIGIEIPLASSALGVKVIEKHFTLDKNMEGWDHKVSANFDELVEIVNGVKRITTAMGSHRIIAPESDEKKREFRRSIVLKNPVEEGQVISNDDIDFKRPGIGISPGELKYVLGRKVNKSLESDHVLVFSDFE
mgnify:CR=1 FL=1